MKTLFFIGSILFSLALNAQAKTVVDIKTMEDSLVAVFEKLDAPLLDDGQKLSINNEFKVLLYHTLLMNTSFKHDFKKIKNLNVLGAPDKKFKIYTWVFATSDGAYHYYGFTQYNDKKNKTFVLRELKDNSALKDEYTEYSDSVWYGAVYYEIVPVKTKNNSSYILLGWDGNNWMSTKKIIEPIAFNHEGKISFGKKVLKEKEEEIIKVKKNDKPIRTQKKEGGLEKLRIIFEYSSQTSMSLRYNKNMKSIVFDHLAPSDPAYTNMFMFYAPDFSYDAYYYKNNNWYLRRSIDMRNSKTIKAQKYEPQSDEDIKLKEVEFKRN